MLTELISPGNAALTFVDGRILDDHYRGDISSQHNRFDMDDVITILRLLDKNAPGKSLMRIRDEDISKRPNNTVEERAYATFCQEAKESTHIGTQDAMRKNILVDFHRMGIINRYNVRKEPTDPFKQIPIKYVSLTDDGIKLFSNKNIVDRYFIFSKGLDKLLSGSIGVLLDLLRDAEADLKNISKDEYMLFVSAVNTSASFSISLEECVALIKSFRGLSRIQINSVVATLKAELKPSRTQGSKTQKRDYGNWMNKIEQIFSLLKQTAYFEVRDSKVYLSNEHINIEAETTLKRLDRSLDQKYQYFARHKVQKEPGFELHHVVPLSWSENVQHFKLLDNWQNMVYIDAFSHAKITQNRNRNVNMQSDGKDVILSDFIDNKVALKFQENILYDYQLMSPMLEYNKELVFSTNK